jgi:arylsulfatase A-like enzyme
MDGQVVEHALEVIHSGLPGILFIHLPSVDSAGHITGWMSENQLTVINWADSLIGEIIAALEAGDYLEHTLLIITADHGGSDLSHGSDSPEDMTIPWLAVGPGVLAGLTLQSDVMVYDTAATALYALDIPIPEGWDGRPVMEIFGEELEMGTVVPFEH